MFRELWKFRFLIRQLAVRDLKARYKVSVLGFFWSLLRPLLTMVILAAVFSMLDFDSSTYAVPYYVLLFASYMPWFFLSSALLEGTQSLISNAHLVKKVYCPRAVFPSAVGLSNLINFLFSLAVVLPVLYLATPAQPTFLLLQLPLVILVNTVLLLGLCYAASVINVLYRDTTQIVEFLVFVWFYMTPVLYDAYEVIKAMPKLGCILYFLNPMAGLNEWYRYIFLASHFRQQPEFAATLENYPMLERYNAVVYQFAIPYAIIFSVVILFVGYALMKKWETRAVDEM